MRTHTHTKLTVFVESLINSERIQPEKQAKTRASSLPFKIKFLLLQYNRILSEHPKAFGMEWYGI